MIKDYIYKNYKEIYPLDITQRVYQPKINH